MSGVPSWTKTGRAMATTIGYRLKEAGGDTACCFSHRPSPGRGCSPIREVERDRLTRDNAVVMVLLSEAGVNVAAPRRATMEACYSYVADWNLPSSELGGRAKMEGSAIAG